MSELLTLVLNSPWSSMALLAVGLVLAGVVAPVTHQELEIVRGTEVAILAVARLALRGQLEHFFMALMAFGLAMPLVAGSTTPLYYSRGFRWEHFLEMAGIMLVPGLGLAGLGLVGLRRVKAKREVEEKPVRSLVVDKLAQGTEGALALIAATLAAGEWNDFTVAVVAGGALFGVAAITLTFVLQSPFTRGEIGLGLAAFGGLFALGSLIVMVTGGGRTTEAILGIPPGLVVMFVGLGMAGRGSPPTPSGPGSG